MITYTTHRMNIRFTNA